MKWKQKNISSNYKNWKTAIIKKEKYLEMIYRY